MNRRNFIVGAGSIGAATIGGAAVLSGSAAAELDGNLDLDDPDVVSVDDGSFQYITTALASVFEWQGFEDEATQATFVSELRLPDNNEPQGSWHELYNSTLSLANIASGDVGGSLEWATGEGHNGVLHFGVGDADPILSDHVDQFDRDYDFSDAWDSLEGQGTDARWPVIVHPDYEGDLYDVPKPFYTDTPEASKDGGQNTTKVTYRKTVIVHDNSFNPANDDASNYGSAAKSVLSDDFKVTIHNINSDSTASGEGDTSVETDPDKTASE